ncbi:MAG: M6 family metalloprotease domain-containing protein [Bacteroidales bacterium]|nr:M6 family metalloprotease domain-containing protein [Bacteroidales bacterium]
MKKIFTLLVACLAAATLRALPADPRPRVVVQPDGSRITVRLCGDEYFHFLLSVDSIPLVEENGYHFYARPEGTAWISSGLRAADPDRRSAADLLFLRGIDRRAAVDSLCMQWRRQRDAMGALRRMPSPRRAPGEPQRAVPTKGSQRSLALLVTFPKTTDDGEATVFSVDDPRQLFDDMLNKPGFDYDGATGSVKDYFRDASNGQYDITFDVFGPVELSKDISFYGQNFNGGDLNAWNMVVEACAQLDDQIDFTLYDSDRNGEVDNIYVFYAGLGEANGGERYTIWQHAGEVETLSGQQYIFDGVRVNRYACSNELRPITDEATGISSLHLEGIGVVCHEFTHVLDFPDLYDVASVGCFTPGRWSLMDIGPYNNDTHTPPTFSAYERMCMGWLTPEVLDGTPRNLVMEDVKTNVGYRIDTPQGDDEFFILENRQQTGWDAYLPGHGMLVWHITYDDDLWASNRVNSNPYFQGIDLVEADAIRSEETRAGDAFPGTAGITSLTAATVPALRDQNGVGIDVPLTDIAEKNGIITLKVSGGKAVLPAPTDLQADDVTPIGFTARWQPVEGASAYDVYVYTRTDEGNLYVEGYNPRRTDTNACVVTGLQPETGYVFTVRAISAEGAGIPSDTCSVRTPAATFAYTAPTALPPTGVTATGFTAHWEALPEAEAYELDVLTRSLTDAAVETVDFTDGVKQLPAGWSTNCKMTLSVSGAYGQAAPSLSMPSDNCFLESAAYADDVRTLSLWYRERNAPCGRNYLVVEALTAGTTDWVAVDTLWLTDTAPQSGTEVSWAVVEAAAGTPNLRPAPLPEQTRALRLTYRRVGSGGLAVDDVCVGHGGEETFLPVPGFAALSAGASLSHAVEGLDLTAGTYYYRVRGLSGETRSLSSNVVAVHYDPTGITVPTLRPDGPQVWYDLSGRRVQQPGRGLYIDRQGRKYLRK